MTATYPVSTPPIMIVMTRCRPCYAKRLNEIRIARMGIIKCVKF